MFKPSLALLNVIIIVALCASVFASQVFAQSSPVWERVPLRTQRQKDAGFPGGEGYQAIQTIRYAPTNPNIVYMVIDTTGPWKSIDGGSYWNPIFNGFNSSGAQSVAVHPTNPDIVYAAGSDMASGVLTWGGLEAIYRSTNGGASWTNVRKTTFYREGASKGADLFVFLGANTVFAGTHGEGLLRSTDGGTTWTTVSGGHYIYDLAKTPSGTLYMTTKNGLYRVNSNFTTQLISSGLPSIPTQIEISNTDNNVAYVVVGKYGVYKTTNLGSSNPTFVAINNGMSGTVGTYNARTITASSVDHNYLYLSYKYSSAAAPWGFFYSTNGGASWLVPTTMDLNNYSSDHPWSNKEIGHPYGASIACHPTNKNIALTLNGVEAPKKTTNAGDTWVYTGSGYTGGAMAIGGPSTFAFDLADRKRFMIFLHDFGPHITEDSGSTFIKRLAPNNGGWGSTAGGAIEPVTNPQVVVSASGSWDKQKISVSRNKGLTWNTVTTPDTTGFYDLSLLAFNPSNANIIYAGKFKSVDKGYNWSALSRPVREMYRKDGNIVYSQGVSNGKTIILKSTDGGKSWPEPFFAPIPATGQVGKFAVAPNDPNRVYVPMKVTSPANQAGIWIVTPSAAVLRNNTHGLDLDHQQPGQLNYYSVAVDPNHPNVIYAGQAVGAGLSEGSGVSRSTDFGNTWTNISNNLSPWFGVNTLTVNPHDSYVYMNGFMGTWKFPPPGTSSVDTTPPSGSLSINGGAGTTTSSTVTLNLSASDSIGVTGYFVSNSSTPPQLNTSGWVAVTSTTAFSKQVAHLLLTGTGTRTAYAWYRDAAGNISSMAADSIEVQGAALSVSAKKTLSPLAIDGKLSEGAWDLSQSVVKLVSGTNNNTTTFGALWDGSYLYVGIKVLDSTLFNDSADVWADDGVEIYIDGNHNHGANYDGFDRQFIKGYNDTSLTAPQNANGVLHGTASISGGYTVELAIPWSNLGISAANDITIGFDVQNNDDDNGGNRDGVKDWNSSQDINYSSTLNFGHLVLSSETVGANVPPSAPTGVRVVQ